MGSTVLAAPWLFPRVGARELARGIAGTRTDRFTKQRPWQVTIDSAHRPQAIVMQHRLDAAARSPDSTANRRAFTSRVGVKSIRSTPRSTLAKPRFGKSFDVLHDRIDPTQIGETV
jgi:hypothetical protein